MGRKTTEYNEIPIFQRKNTKNTIYLGKKPFKIKKYPYFA